MSQRNRKIIGWIVIILIIANIILYGFLQNEMLLWGVIIFAAAIAFPGMKLMKKMEQKNTEKKK